MNSVQTLTLLSSREGSPRGRLSPRLSVQRLDGAIQPALGIITFF